MVILWDAILNVYQESGGAALVTQPLDGDARADVAIVGGGFTGLSTALHLAERGAKVILVEAEEPGWGASGRNGGQVNPGLKFDPDVVERTFGEDLGGRMNALSGGAPDLVFALIARHRIACEARRNGTLRAAVGSQHAAKIRLSVSQWRRRNAPVELLEGAALAAATGTDRYPAAMWDRRGGDLNPLSYARGLAGAARRAGATIHGGTRVQRLASRGDRWHLSTARGILTADSVVLATNGYTDDLWPGLRRSLIPLWGSIAATEPLPDALAQRVMPGRAVLYESGAITVYYRVDAAGRLLIGGRGPQREISSLSSLAHLIDYAKRLWPPLESIRWTHAWTGRLAMTRDQFPHVHEPARGLSVSLGYNGRGIAMATAMGLQLAKRIVSPREPFDMPITAISPIRFHAAWPLAVKAAIVKGRMLDFIGA